MWVVAGEEQSAHAAISCVMYDGVNLDPLILPCLPLQIHIINGALVCPNCGRKYPIINGIPNMLLNENET